VSTPQEEQAQEDFDEACPACKYGSCGMCGKPFAALAAPAVPTQPEPVPWPTFESASADPLFHECRAIMGTTDVGQDEALLRAINNFVARRSINTLRAAHPSPPTGAELEALPPLPKAAGWLEQQPMYAAYTADQMVAYARAAVAAATPPAPPQQHGHYKLLPIEPTEDMAKRFMSVYLDGSFALAYRALIAAAPTVRPRPSVDLPALRQVLFNLRAARDEMEFGEHRSRLNVELDRLDVLCSPGSAG
jgi:hypothetical protein